MKYLLLYLLSSIILFASDVSQYKVKILETIMQEILVDSEIYVWCDNDVLLNELKNHHIIHTTQNCQSANLLIIENDNVPEKCMNKYIFVLKYNLLSDIKHSFGALFWKKGRPNIIILEPRIKAQSIMIKEELKPYLEEKIW